MFQLILDMFKLQAKLKRQDPTTVIAKLKSQIHLLQLVSVMSSVKPQLLREEMVLHCGMVFVLLQFRLQQKMILALILVRLQPFSRKNLRLILRYTPKKAIVIRFIVIVVGLITIEVEMKILLVVRLIVKNQISKKRLRSDEQLIIKNRLSKKTN